MALEEYRRKRDFTKSPEPTGNPARAKKTPVRFFCVQKHLASHLHYDFRLEYDGVLRSWAVPKGPSLDPTVKRLAMHVEDHPLEYGEFEGVIPEGYGAGIVMLWDRGTWSPEVEDVDAALRKGDLKFTLNGYKLKGSWVLVRTGGYSRSRSAGSRDDRSWLLIKHRDEWAGDLDITSFAPRSVKSDGDLEDILAADTPALWLSNRPAKGGEAGAMLAAIIERAAALKAGRQPPAPARGGKTAGPDIADSPGPRPASSTARGPNPARGGSRGRRREAQAEAGRTAKRGTEPATRRATERKGRR